MEPNTNSPADPNDETALDKEIQDSIDSVKAGNTVVAEPQPKVAEIAETPSAPVATEPASPAPAEAEPKIAEDPQKPPTEEFKTPVKGKFESEESYQKRLDLAGLVKQRKTARTEEEKQRLSGAIANTRKELSTINSANKINNPPNNEANPAEPKPKTPEDEKKAADIERLKEIGGVTKEDIAEMQRQSEYTAEVRNTLQNFVNRHPELKDDEDAREVFFDFVDSNYKWDDKSGKDLMTVLELARESMFKPSETIQERVLKGANVQEKVNAMQFPGGTIVKPGLTPDQQKSVDEMKAAGMSEEKALELISD